MRIVMSRVCVIWKRVKLWRHNEGEGVSNHQPHDCLLNRLFKAHIKGTSKLRVTGLCEGNSPVNSEFHAQRASNAENVSIWWRHHDSFLVTSSSMFVYIDSSLYATTNVSVFTLQYVIWNRQYLFSSTEVSVTCTRLHCQHTQLRH